MHEIKPIGAGLDPDDLWRNLFWLRERVEKLEEWRRQQEAKPKPAYNEAQRSP